MTTRFTKPDRAQPDRTQPLWRSFLAPMLLASLGLHGLILLLPAGSQDSAVIPPPDPEQDSVAITRVPPPGTADTGVASSTGAPIPGAVPIPVNPAAPVAAAQPRSAFQGRSPVAPTRPATAARRSPPQAQPQSRPPARSNPSPSPTTAPPSGSTAPSNPAPSPAPASRPLFNAPMGEQLLAYVASLNLPQGQIDRAAASIQDRFGYNAAAVTRDTFNRQKAQWESAIRQDTGLADLSVAEDRTKFSTVYPQRVCLVDSPKPINIGALVNPDGTWRGEPTLLRSSGYGALDRKALQEIQGHRFAPTEGVRAYVLTVDPTVDYGRRPCLNPNPDV